MSPITPEVGFFLDESERPQEVEILYMHKQVVEDDIIYNFEISFMSDHQVLARSAKNGVWSPYKRKIWEKLENIYRVAEEKSSTWEIVWNPMWQPKLTEFTKSVKF